VNARLPHGRPLQDVALDADARFEFAGGILLTATPAWVAKEKMLDSLSEWDRKAVQESPFCLIATYEAAALGDPDPAWAGSEPKSIQDTKYELCVLANLALWLRRASPAHFVVVLHAPQFGDTPITQRVSRHSPLLCHPEDVGNRVKATDIPVAVQLHQALVGTTRDTSLWTAIRATWAGLQTNVEVVRYALFWMALEALFGPEDAQEITFRLSQRIAFLRAENSTQAKQFFALAKKGYGFRSKIVHGRWKDDPESTTRMAEVEELVRRSFGCILTGAALRDTFSGKGREAYLDELSFPLLSRWSSGNLRRHGRGRAEGSSCRTIARRHLRRR